MILYDSVWLCMTLYDSVWLCMTLCDSVCLCMTLYEPKEILNNYHTYLQKIRQIVKVNQAVTSLVY